MGTDMTLFLGYKVEEGSIEYHKESDLWGYRNYGLYGFLAGVRNYSAIKPLSKPRGLPESFPENLKHSYEDNPNYGSASYYYLDELLAVDYNQLIEDRRCTIGCDGGATCTEGQGKEESLADFLGDYIMADLYTMRDMGVHCVVFWFD